MLIYAFLFHVLELDLCTYHRFALIIASIFKCKYTSYISFFYCILFFQCLDCV